MHPAQLFQALGVPPLPSSDPYNTPSYPSLQRLANPSHYGTPNHLSIRITPSVNAASPNVRAAAKKKEHKKVREERRHSRLQPSSLEFYDASSPYFEFSNRSPHPIIVHGLCYPTAEHYWLCSQFIDYMPDIAELVRSMPTVQLAAETAEKYSHLRNPQWNPGKELYKAMERKFKQYGHLADMLVRTRRRPLIYANPYDRFWGYDKSKREGKNMFGMYLSNVRDYLRSEGFTKDISPIWITDRKRDAYFGLTTFSDHPVADDSGEVYRTAEHLLQALRFPDDDEMRYHFQEQLWDSSPQMAQEEGAKYAHRGRNDWDDDLVLRANLINVLTLKVSQHQDLLELLEDTGDRELLRVGPHRYWHDVDGLGDNQYGEILMAIRETMQDNLWSYGLTSVRQLDGVDAPGQEQVPVHFSNESAGLHHYLSNFFVAPLTDGKGRSYHTAEHLFQAWRFKHDEEILEHIRVQPSALGAREEAERYRARQRTDWNDVRVDVMDWVVRTRICLYQDFADALDATRDAELILDDPEDDFWGSGSDLAGQNELGRALMRARQWLRDRRPRGDESDDEE